MPPALRLNPSLVYNCWLLVDGLHVEPCSGMPRRMTRGSVPAADWSFTSFQKWPYAFREITHPATPACFSFVLWRKAMRSNTRGRGPGGTGDLLVLFPVLLLTAPRPGPGVGPIYPPRFSKSMRGLTILPLVQIGTNTFNQPLPPFKVDFKWLSLAFENHQSILPKI